MKNRFINKIVMCVLAVSFASIAIAGTSVEIRLKNGSAWRGELNDNVVVQFVDQNLQIEFKGQLVKTAKMYIVVEGDIAGELKEKVIYKGDIRSIQSLSDLVSANLPRNNKAKSQAVSSSSPDDQESRGIFFLPLKGPVGETLRHNEIEMIGKEADKYGPGQIIVFQIKSNGGFVFESEFITEAIWDLKKRHRVIAWIEKAISAGCSTAMACDEIYMMTEGIAGSVTTVMGKTAVSEKEAQPGIDFLVRVAKEAGHSEHIARSMKLRKYLCSYDVDPETGEVTIYGDLSGEFILSDEKSNLCFNSDNALHCGFSDGTADTKDELANLLDLPRWNEVNDYGRKIAKRWTNTVEKAIDRIPRLLARRGYWKTGSGDAEVRIGALIRIDLELLKWIDVAPLIAEYKFGLPREIIERELKELRKTLADMKKAKRRR
ncbi:MAG: hypothetical protein IH984_06730 [Planctomycetes bacterium]|nr:hypothetical protein [Planctomycetota bacterium]